MNLTAVRDPEQVVTRHFGESLFAAQNLFPSSFVPRGSGLIDIGSGAGFPGLPIKIWAVELHVTLIESQNKKATFLKEVIRALELKEIDVSTSRAEDYKTEDYKSVGPGAIAGAAHNLPEISPAAGAPPAATRTTVTLRAVEKFDRILPVAAQLASAGRLALLIGSVQVATAQKLLPKFTWSEPLAIPQSLSRVLLIGESN